MNADTWNTTIRAKLDLCQSAHEDYRGCTRTLNEVGCERDWPDHAPAIEEIETDWMMHADADAEIYHRMIASVNPIGRLDVIMTGIRDEIAYAREWMLTAVRAGLLTPDWAEEHDVTLCAVLGLLNKSVDLVVNMPAKTRSQACECGAMLQIMPETAEMHCDECGMVKTISGSASEAAVVHTRIPNGKEIIRHFKFWIERLQAIENVTFPQELLDKIQRVMKREHMSPQNLTVTQMRIILKDPMVKSTKFNDHAPSLIKRLGGPAPPVHTYEDLEVTKSRFVRAMILLDQIAPNGNKPYYPHFIYKIIEEQHKGNPEKLRTLDYIHMQTEDTIVKNDHLHKQICALANDPSSGLVFRPTRVLR
jgi:Poxvirus Late Transcription Factor VLTF3 like